MVNRDPRYDLIKSLYERGKIASLNDIFTYVPKTRVATDLGKRGPRFTAMMKDVRQFTLEEVLLIGHFCDLEEKIMFKLLAKEYFNQKAQKSTNHKKVS